MKATNTMTAAQLTKITNEEIEIDRLMLKAKRAEKLGLALNSQDKARLLALLVEWRLRGTDSE